MLFYTFKNETPDFEETHTSDVTQPLPLLIIACRRRQPIAGLPGQWDNTMNTGTCLLADSRTTSRMISLPRKVQIAPSTGAETCAAPSAEFAKTHSRFLSFKRSALHLTSFCRTRDMNTPTLCDASHLPVGTTTVTLAVSCVLRRFSEWENLHAPCALFRVRMWVVRVRHVRYFTSPCGPPAVRYAM